MNPYTVRYKKKKKPSRYCKILNVKRNLYRFKDHLKPISDDLVVLNKNLFALERNHLNLC